MKIAPALVALLTLTLAGCGFRPLYAVPGHARGQMQASFRAIYVEPVGERLGYELRNQMIDVIDGAATPAGAKYRLRLNIDLRNEAIGVQSQQVGTLKQTVITRYNDQVSVGYELSDMASGTTLLKGTETGIAAYNVQSSPYATLVSQQSADKRATGDIADRVRIALAAYFAQKK